MSEPSQFTAQQASDPATPAEVLHAIAEHRPDLRPLVAANPATYPGLLDWLARLGDPGVDDALAARAAGPLPPSTPAATDVFGEPDAGVAPAADVPPAGAAYPPPGQPGYPPPGYPPMGYAAPGQVPPGYPPAESGAPYASPGYPPAGGPLGAPGGPPPKRGKGWIWILVAVLVVLALGVALVIGLVVRNARTFAERLPDILPTSGTDPFSYGDDPALDRLWDACEDGDMQACDDLFRRSPIGSEYEDFGNTCGNRTDGSSFCVDRDPGETPSDGEATPQDPSTPAAGPDRYGDDPALDALWDACEGGDMGACDSLYRQSPNGSEYWQFGDTCGDRQAGGRWCDV